MKGIERILRNWLAWIRGLWEEAKDWLSVFGGYWVTVDGTDNSVTLSRGLWRDIRNRCKGAGKLEVIVFMAGKEDYGFMVSDGFKLKTQVSDIQYNPKYKTIGFESLCPTVNKILYDYGLPCDRFKLSVHVERVGQNKAVYYRIMRPVTWRGRE